MITAPAPFLFWFSVHPWRESWRWIGVWPTMGLHFLLMAVTAFSLFAVRDRLLGADFGFRPLFLLTAIPMILLALWLARIGKRVFGARLITGAAEILGEKDAFVTDGIYAFIRHPRYLELMLFYWAAALISNYFGAWLAAAGVLLATQVLVRLEERELRERFGPAWEEYAARTPRFLPKRKSEE